MTERKQPLSRRTWLAGAATAGTAAVAVPLLQSAPKPAVQAAASTSAHAGDPDGYQLTEHVKRYYASARI
jgi:hypothetical protein